MLNKKIMKKILLILGLFFLSASCERSMDQSNKTDFLLLNYCSLGASTASMSWQEKVALSLAKNYKTFSIPGSRWAHTDLSSYDLSDDGSKNANNLLMTNQLARLLKEKAENKYEPDIITVFCGLNDAANGSRVLGNYNESLSYNLNVTPEEWFSNIEYKKIRNTVYGSSRFVIGSLVRNFPNSKIIILTNQQCNNNTYNNYNTSLVNEALISAANYYKLNVIDIFNESGIVVKDGAPSPYLGADQLHPNALGEELLYNFVSQKIKEIIKK